MFQKFFAKTVQLLSQYAAEPEDSEEWRLKKTIGVVMVVMGSLSWIAYGLMYLPFDEPFAVSVCIIESILFIMGLLSYGFSGIMPFTGITGLSYLRWGYP